MLEEAWLEGEKRSLNELQHLQFLKFLYETTNDRKPIIMKILEVKESKVKNELFQKLYQKQFLSTVSGLPASWKKCLC